MTGIDTTTMTTNTKLEIDGYGDVFGWSSTRDETKVPRRNSRIQKLPVYVINQRSAPL